MTKIIRLTVLAIFLYPIFWAIAYRVPASPARTVDLRSSKDAAARYVMICASLADNPHGFPGHCYVVLNDTDDDNVLHGTSISYTPARYWDQIPSLVGNVKGVLGEHAALGNTRNLDRVIAIVDVETYNRALLDRASWSMETFRAGERDCVSFADQIARTIGLRTPDHHNKFPQDYVRELKTLN